MKTEKLFAVLIATAVLQTVSMSGQDLFRVTVSGTVRPGQGNSASSRISNRTLIENCVGTETSARDLNRNFAVVYNATEDSIQVVNRADGSVVCDVFHFEGGTSTVVQNRLVRMTFIFRPDQADSVGSAVVTESANRSANAATVRPRISGKMQFSKPATTTVATESTEATIVEVPTTTVT